MPKKESNPNKAILFLQRSQKRIELLRQKLSDIGKKNRLQILRTIRFPQ